MRTCVSCSANIEPGDKFCIACGTPAAAENPATTADDKPFESVAVTTEAFVPPPSAPAALPVPSPEMEGGTPPPPDMGAATEPATGDDAGGRGFPLMAVLVGVVALIVVGVVVFTVSRGGDSSADRYQGPNTRAMTFRDNDGWYYSEYDSDDRPTDLGEFFESANVLDPSGTNRNVVEAGGPIVGGMFDNDERTIAYLVDDEMTTLADGGDYYSTYFDPERGNLLAIETRQSGDRCYVGALDEQPRRLGRGDSCWFSDGGQYVIAMDLDNDEWEYEVLNLEGETILSETSVRRPQFVPTERSLVSFDGNPSRYSATLVDISTGEVLAESSAGDPVVVLDSLRSGAVLVASANDGEAVLEILHEDGRVVELWVNEGPLAANFLDDDGSSIFVHQTETDGSTASIVQVDDDGAVTDAAIAADMNMAVKVPSDRSARQYVAVMSSDGGPDAVLAAQTDAGLIEVDIDDLTDIYGWSAAVSSDRRQMFVTTQTFNGVHLINIDLITGDVRWLVEEWNYLTINDIATDGGGVALTGQEDPLDDQVAAYVATDGTFEIAVEYPTEFVSYMNVLFAADGKSLLTGVIADGDAETLRYELGSRTQAEVIERNMALVDAGWSNGWSSLFEPRSISIALPNPGCNIAEPTAVELAVGSAVSGDLGAFDEDVYCLNVTGEATVSVTVSGEFDSLLHLVGPLGNDEAPVDYFADDDDGFNPILREFLAPGAYRITVTGWEGASGGYEITVD